MMIRKVKRISKRLVMSYSKGLISYPRVSNSYQEKTSFFSSPHVGFEPFDEYSTGLKNNFYPLDKRTIILELSNVEILTPSTIENVFETIDLYYDDNLNIRKGMEDKLRVLMEEFNEYLDAKGNDIEVNDLCKDGKVSCQSSPMDIYRIELSPKDEQSVKEKYPQRSKKEKAINFKKDIVFEKVNFLEEAETLFKKRQKKLQNNKSNDTTYKSGKLEKGVKAKIEEDSESYQKNLNIF